MDDSRKIFNVISCIDYISMIMILFYHSLYYVSLYTEITTTSMLHAFTFLNIFGLTGFTFSSGFKLVFNHYENLKNKNFYNKYTIKRVISLSKDYLTFPIIFFIILNTLHFGFSWFGKEELLTVYYNQVSPLNLTTISNFLFFGITPVAQQLWYIYILLIVNVIVLLGFRVYGYRTVLFGIFPLLLIYFSIKRHIVGSISIKSEIPYYVLLYMTIFLFGSLTSYLYHTNKKYFKSLLIAISSLFVIIIIGFIHYEVNASPFPNNYYFQLLYGNPFFKYGLTFPVFLMGFLLLFKNTKLVSVVAKNRKYSMLIYVMQYPFTIPFYCELLSKYGLINKESTLMAWISPFLVTLLSVITCILIYNLYKKSVDIYKNWREGKRVKKQVSLGN